MTLPTVDSSARAVPRERNANDWYVEPAWAVEGLLDVQRFSGRTLDPACGSGTIPSVLIENGLYCDASDLVDRGWGNGDCDFLSEDYRPPGGGEVDNTISNPPFDRAEQFLRKALSISRHKVAFLLRLSWLEGRRRRWIHDETPLAAVHPFAARVSMPPGGRGIVAKGGAVAFAWYVWDHSWPIGAPPILRRIERGPK